MEIASDVALNQTGLKRRRRRSSARLVRLAVAAGLIGLVFTSPSEAIYLLALTSMPLMMLYGELSVLERSLLVLLYLAGISVLYVLIALMSSRKTPILYLRKFGLSRANRMVTRAIEGGLGRQYRVLTLDDSDFKPLEIPRIERILSRVAIPIALLLLLVTLVSFMGGEKLGLPESVVVRLFYWLPVAYGYGGILLIWPLLTLIAVVFAVLVYRWRIRRSFKLEIRSREQIYGCLIRAQRLARWLMRPSMMAPQALVVKVIDELWQEAVSTLAEGLHLVVCDVSEPTHNLIWEVERMSALPAVRCLFVGNGPLVRSWVKQPVDADPEAPHLRMKRLLQGQTILVFDPTRPFVQRRFNRSLRNCLDNFYV